MRYLALLLFAAPAFADVYVYDSNGQAIGQKPALAADDIVRRCYQYTGPEIEPGTHTGCAAYEHAPASTVADWGWLYTTDGWCRRRDLPCAPPAPEFSFSGYPCKPKSWSEIRVGKEGNAAAAVWYCDTPTVIWRAYYCGNPANIPATILTTSLEALGLLAESKVSRGCTPEEIALVNKLHEAEGVKITVAPTRYATRPVYARNEDNTRGSTIGARAPIGAPCGRKRLQTSTGKATNYFQFGDGYTLCKVDGEVSK